MYHCVANFHTRMKAIAQDLAPVIFEQAVVQVSCAGLGSRLPAEHLAGTEHIGYRLGGGSDNCFTVMELNRACRGDHKSDCVNNIIVLKLPVFARVCPRRISL